MFKSVPPLTIMVAAFLLAATLVACGGGNTPPRASALSNITVAEGATDQSIDLSEVFNDAEDSADALTYQVRENTVQEVVTPSVVGNTLTLDFGAPGSSTITLRAVDTGSLTVDIAFTVTVENTPPTTSGLSDITVNLGTEGRNIDLSAAFSDLDSLTYTLTENTNPSVVDATIDGATLTLAFTSAGSSNVTVRATDTGDQFVEASFTVTVNATNTSPVTSGIDDLTVNVGAADRAFDLTASFGDNQQAASTLLYEVVQNEDPDVVTSSTREGSTLVLSFGARGQSSLTVRATDDEGLSVNTSFAVVVNGSPTTLGISDVTVNENASSLTLNLAASFSDAEDGAEALSYAVVGNSDTNVVTTSLTAGVLTLDFGQPGSSEITVEATDSNGLSVRATFTVTVSETQTNTSPTTEGIDDVTAVEDDANRTLDLTASFNDAEDGPAGLVYSVQNNTDSAVVAARIDSTTLVLDFLAPGSSDITLRATDSGGLSVSATFTVIVRATNTAPTTSGIANITVNRGAADRSLDLAASFSDAEDGAANLTYSVLSNSDQAVVATNISGTTLSLDFGQAGQSEITVRATDSGGLSVSTTFRVTVNEVNTSPTTSGIADITVEAGTGDRVLVLSASFSDAEESADALDYSVVSNTTPAVVTASITGTSLTLNFDTPGNSDLTVRATDSGGLSVSTTFRVTVDQASSSEPQIVPVSTTCTAQTQAGDTCSVSVALRNYDERFYGFEFQIDFESDNYAVNGTARPGDITQDFFFAGLENVGAISAEGALGPGEIAVLRLRRVLAGGDVLIIGSAELAVSPETVEAVSGGSLALP